jgi:ATP-binding cassette subfamily B protein
MYLLKQLWPHLRHYRGALLLGALFIIISNVFAIYPAQLVRESFDLVGVYIKEYNTTTDPVKQAAIRDEGVWLALKYGGLVLAMALLRGLFLFFMRQTIIVVSRKVEYDQKRELFGKFQGLSLRLLRKQRTGDLMARISEDVSNVRMFTGPGLMYTFNTITLFVMILVTMLAVNPLLTLYVLMPLPLLALAIFVVHKIIIQRTDVQQQQLSLLSSFTQEVFSGIRVLKAYVREQNAADRFDSESKEFMRRALRLVAVDALFFPIIMLMIGASIVFTIWVGGEEVIAGNITYGNIAEFILYVNLLIWPVTALGWVTSLSQRAVASQQRIAEVLALQSELHFPEQGPEPSNYTLEMRGVSLCYPDTGIEALKQVNATLPQGQTIGIVGPTGSGKTSLANLLVRLMDPDTGSITLGGHPLKDYAEPQLRQWFGYVQQDVLLFSDTIARNIAFAKPEATPTEIAAAARFAGVYDDIMGFPDGFETMVGERGVSLSGGQKQRISIARAWLTKPSIFILDDALSAVDAVTEAHIVQQLRDPEAFAGQVPTLIIISHRIRTVQHADLILVLEDGHITQQGTHEALLADTKGYYARLHQRQELETQVEQ